MFTFIQTPRALFQPRSLQAYSLLCNQHPLPATSYYLHPSSSASLSVQSGLSTRAQSGPLRQSHPRPSQTLASHQPASSSRSDLVKNDPALACFPSAITHTLNNIIDPFALLAHELRHIKQSIKSLVGSEHVMLNRIAKYYLSTAHQGKHLRPLIVLLISRATASPIDCHRHSERQTVMAIDQSISPAEILNDSNPNVDLQSSNSLVDHQSGILPSQMRLAEIAELIHVASLLHDDVIDDADSRRGQASSPKVFGSKLSVLAGDFLLARASVALSRLGSLEVVELISSVISNLVEGELMQISTIVPTSPKMPKPPSTGNEPLISSADDHKSQVPQFANEFFKLYERKNYLKTASLMAKTARAAVILSSSTSPENRNQELIESSYEFGKHLGLAFQIVDDILDYTSTDDQLGKPGNGSDLRAGLVTGPGLFAWQQFGEQFGKLVARKFAQEGDLELAKHMVLESNGIAKSYDLARSHIRRCQDELGSGNVTFSEVLTRLFLATESSDESPLAQCDARGMSVIREASGEGTRNVCRRGALNTGGWGRKVVYP
ncbi:hypothetical protein O181_080679 [Austropuccinia psidii MF-1]|uniref:(2E,6E)-farnesyl diphosphate synthase n=1 Tax=Austropuccinia psidii MF-1 TaxID=1389203 RepID=A0A9Q3FLD4_9BASI|nr:hypothetical protein [Austropuccinia psidii MF-1]